MGLENPTYIEDLNASWPLASDPVSEGDDHTRNLKSTIQASFPGTSGPWNAPTANFQCLGISTSGDIYCGDDLAVVRNFSVVGTSQFNGNATFDLDIGCRDVNARNLVATGTLDVTGAASLAGDIVDNHQVAVASAKVNSNGTTDTEFGFGTITRTGEGTYDLTLSNSITGASTQAHIQVSGTSGVFCGGGLATDNTSIVVQMVNVVSGALQDADFTVTVFDMTNS
jgi:hypothetical protein